MSVHAEGVEETSADVEPKRRHRFSFAGQIPSAVAPGEQRREGLLLGADLLPQRLGENRAARIPPAHPSLAVSVDPDRHELVGLLDWKRAETERVDELENRRVGAGAERQSQDRHERECRIPEGSACRSGGPARSCPGTQSRSCYFALAESDSGVTMRFRK